MHRLSHAQCIGWVMHNAQGGHAQLRTTQSQCNRVSVSFHLLRSPNQVSNLTHQIDRLKISMFDMANEPVVAAYQICLDSPSSKTTNFSGHRRAASFNANPVVVPFLRSVQRLPTP